MPYGGFDFNAAIFVPFFIAYLVAIMEALGVYQAATEIQGTKFQDRQVRYGLAGEAAGSAISSLIGGFTTTAYPQNVALLKVTDEGKTRTRVPVIIAGVVFVVLGFIPKAGAVLSLIPSPVIGGIFLPAAAKPHQHRLQHAAQGGKRRPHPSGDRPFPAAWHRPAERVERS